MRWGCCLEEIWRSFENVKNVFLFGFVGDVVLDCVDFVGLVVFVEGFLD